MTYTISLAFIPNTTTINPKMIKTLPNAFLFIPTDSCHVWNFSFLHVKSVSNTSEGLQVSKSEEFWTIGSPLAVSSQIKVALNV